jgi:hypothetical protein
VFLSWLGRGVATGSLEFRCGRLSWQVWIFAISIVFGVVRGAAGGGDMYIAFWEVRWLILLIISFILTSSMIQTQRQIKVVTSILLLAGGFHAAEGVYRQYLISSGRLTQFIDDAWGHEDSLFLVALTLFVLVQRVFGAGPRWQRFGGPLIAVVALYTVFVSQRRAGPMMLMVGFLVVSLVFLVVRRKAFFCITVPVLIGVLLYLPVFWNNTSVIGQPARAIRSLVQPDPRDAASNQYRELEKTNVRATIQNNAVLGVGFGREFEFVVPLPDLSSWPFWHYEPHVNVLWVWLKTGAIGFVVFWIMIGSAILEAANLSRRMRDPQLRAVVALSLAVLVCAPVFCYVDTGLTFPRFTIFLGIIMGMLSVLHRFIGAPTGEAALVQAG